jgi:hypothetical protein
MSDIFVFGSNFEGIHKKGAALEALKNHGAVMGIGEGLQGNSYAIPTKATPWVTLPLIAINCYVAKFLAFAKGCPDLIFNVTPIGCGLAGYEPQNIAPMFRLATTLHNVRLPKEFLHYLDKEDWF